MTNKILLMAAVAAFAAEVSYGLTTQEIADQSRSSVVLIVEENTATHVYWKETGWFITENRIVTNNHIVSNPDSFNRLYLINVETGQRYTLDHIAYNDGTTDVAVIVINESNSTHLNLSELNPAAGMDVVVIGNPEGAHGKVTTGTIEEVYEYEGNKRTNFISLDAGIQKGSSGSPVLDTNGYVLGMIWGGRDTGDGHGAAVNVKTLQLAQIDVVDYRLHFAITSAEPVDSESRDFVAIPQGNP
jgi:serine protease Do